MGMDTPIWLNNDFLEKALNSEKPNSRIRVISGEVKPAVAAGGNYASDMFRATVKVKNGTREEDISIIIKASYTEGEFSEVMDDEVFMKEINALTEVIPKLQTFLDKAAPGKFPLFGPQHIYSYVGKPASVIVMEDLTKSGLVVTEAIVGLDLQHCLLVIRTIARFHACSVVVVKNNHEVIRSFKDNILCKEEYTHVDTLFESFIKTVADEVKTWQGYEKHARKLHRLSETVGYHRKRCARTDEKSFNVLIHGDLWRTNTLFKYSEETGEVQDVRFIDFQMSQWTSPAVDLLYFLSSSASPDVLVQHFDTLINVYHKTLQDSLSLLGHEDLAPTRDTIDKEISERGAFGVIAGMSTRVVCLVDKNNPPNFDKMIKGEAGPPLSEEYKISFKALLPFYGKMGWLEF